MPATPSSPWRRPASGRELRFPRRNHITPILLDGKEKVLRSCRAATLKTIPRVTAGTRIQNPGRMVESRKLSDALLEVSSDRQFDEREENG